MRCEFALALALALASRLSSGLGSPPIVVSVAAAAPFFPYVSTLASGPANGFVVLQYCAFMQYVPGLAMVANLQRLFCAHLVKHSVASMAPEYKNLLWPPTQGAWSQQKVPLWLGSGPSKPKGTGKGGGAGDGVGGGAGGS